MSIPIKGMEMPALCQECDLYIDGACYAKGYRDYRSIMDMSKPTDCPLIEVPTPHGRLIDADELVADIKGQAERLWTLDAVSESDYFIERNEKFRQAMLKAWCDSLFAYLDTRPTIIEAEEGG